MSRSAAAENTTALCTVGLVNMEPEPVRSVVIVVVARSA
jgi:hypothetical protein